MKFTATVVGIMEHTRLNLQEAREKFKDVVTLAITDTEGIVTGVQPIRQLAGHLELHVPADAGWDALRQGQQVTVELTPAAEETPSAPAPAVPPPSPPAPPAEIPEPIVPAAASSESAGELEEVLEQPEPVEETA